VLQWAVEDEVVGALTHRAREVVGGGRGGGSSSRGFWGL